MAIISNNSYRTQGLLIYADANYLIRSIIMGTNEEPYELFYIGEKLPVNWHLNLKNSPTIKKFSLAVDKKLYIYNKELLVSIFSCSDFGCADFIFLNPIIKSTTKKTLKSVLKKCIHS